MIEYVKFLYEITEKAISKGNEKDIIINFATFEAKHNLDLIDVCLKIKNYKLKSEVIQKFDTSSFELFKLGNFKIDIIFEDSGNDLVELPIDLKKTTFEYYQSKSTKYLYEFCIRKSLSLKKFTQCDQEISKHIKIDARLKNLSFAYSALLKKIQKG